MFALNKWQHQGVTSNLEFFKGIDHFESVGQIVVVESHIEIHTNDITVVKHFISPKYNN